MLSKIAEHQPKQISQTKILAFLCFFSSHSSSIHDPRSNIQMKRIEFHFPANSPEIQYFNTQKIYLEIRNLTIRKVQSGSRDRQSSTYLRKFMVIHTLFADLWKTSSAIQFIQLRKLVSQENLLLPEPSFHFFVDRILQNSYVQYLL